MMIAYKVEEVLDVVSILWEGINTTDLGSKIGKNFLEGKYYREYIVLVDGSFHTWGLILIVWFGKLLFFI
jgi:hypothetical protein